MPKWTGKWSGGLTYQTRDNRTVWVIRKDVHGKTRSITLDAKNLQEAEAELALFLRDREGYLTKNEAVAKAQEEAVRLDASTVQSFLYYLKGLHPDGKTPRPEVAPRSERYRKNVRAYLDEWDSVLKGKDLRSIRTRDLKQHLASWSTARKHRIIAFKSFCSYLVDEGLLEASQNPALGLKVPVSRRSTEEKFFPMEEVEKHYAHISAWDQKTRRIDPASLQAVRDVVLLHAKCGLHYSEVERIAKGEAKIQELEGDSEIAATIRFKHKSGDIHTQSIDKQTLAAVKRLQARKGAPVESYVRKVLKIAQKAAKAPRRLLLGQLRHSFVTWSRSHGEQVTVTGKGLPLSLIASVVGHKSPSTTQRFYDQTQVPLMIKLPLKLSHPDDPAY